MAKNSHSSRMNFSPQQIWLRYFKGLLYRQWLCSVRGQGQAVLQLSEKIETLLPSGHSPKMAATNKPNEPNEKEKKILRQCLWYQQRIHEFLEDRKERIAHALVEKKIDREIFRLRNRSTTIR